MTLQAEQQVTEKEIVAAIRKIAARKGRSWLSGREFAEETGIERRRVDRLFGKWNNAVKAAGLMPATHKVLADWNDDLNQERLVEIMLELAEKNGTPYLAMSEVTDLGISGHRIRKHFPGGWAEALKAAGLESPSRRPKKISESELMEDYVRICGAMGRFAKSSEYHRSGKFSLYTCRRHFGDFSAFRIKAIKYGIEKNMFEPELKKAAAGFLVSQDTGKSAKVKHLDTMRGRQVYGKRINCPGLVRAPVNEQGVIFLFAALSQKLGFEVESIKTGFPDCEAKRRMKNEQYHSVRIEFEYKSSNFHNHKHDPTKCDIIVCWHHDWKKCPIEVISLKDYIDNSG